MSTGKSIFVYFYISTDGRIGRKVYWLFGFLPFLVYELLWYFATTYIFQDLIAPASLSVRGLIIAVYLITIWPFLAVLAKRCHDQNASGWSCLIMIVPFLGFLFAILAGLIPGTKGRNKYGPDPRVVPPLELVED